MKRTVTIKGKRYTVSTRSGDDRLDVRGHRCLTGILPAGTTLDAPNLRDLVERAVEEDRERARRASELVQTYVRAQRREPHPPGVTPLPGGAR